MTDWYGLPRVREIPLKADMFPETSRVRGGQADRIEMAGHASGQSPCDTGQRGSSLVVVKAGWVAPKISSCVPTKTALC